MRIHVTCLVILTGFALSACATFKSVQATGEAGVALGTQAAVPKDVVLYCKILLADEIADPKKCDALSKNAPRMSRALSVLGKYGEALKKIASAEDPDVTENISVLFGSASALDLGSISADQEDVVTGAINSIFQLLVQEYRRAEVAQVVKKAAPDVQGMTEAILTYLDLQRELLALVGEHVQRSLRQSPGRCQLLGGSVTEDEQFCLKDNLADRYALVQLQIWVEDQHSKIAAARKTVHAFAQSHAILAKDVDQLDSKDKDIYWDILQQIANIYRDAHTTTTGEPSESDNAAPQS